MENKEIYKKMPLILKGVEAIKKDKKNTMQGFMFRGIDDMYNALHNLFAEHEVFITSDVLEINREDRQTKSGGNLIYTIIKIKFTFSTTDGSSVESIMIGEAMDSGDKSANKAMSTALKYALMQSFLIPTEDLIDSDKDTYTDVEKKKPVKKEDKKKTDLKVNTKTYKEVLKGMISGYTIAQVKTKYNIHIDVENQLTADIEMAIENELAKQEHNNK